MTPFEEKGWKATDKFRVISNCSGGFKPGDIITLSPDFRDDNSSCLMFTNGHSDEWMYLREVERIEPEQWNGEGLPPVGTVCEYKRVMIWCECEVVYHSGRFTILQTALHGELVQITTSLQFRPIRTEREKAIDEIMECTGLRARDGAKEVATAIYDAGYRKQ